MPDKFDVLNDDLSRVLRRKEAPGIFGESAHLYITNPALPEKEISDFETKHGIHLPSDYRKFLMRVGNGGAGPYYGLFPLGAMDKGFAHGPWGDFVGDLATPFWHFEAWNDLNGKPDEEEEEDSEDYELLYETFERRYFDQHQMDGAIPICHLGCALRQWLVVTGPEIGNVWCDDRADYGGVYPLLTMDGNRIGFFEWYRVWLDEVLAKPE